MIPLAETLGVLLLAGIGFGLGRWFGKSRSRWWFLGFCIPFILLLLIGSTRRYSHFEFVPPMSWLVSGRTEFALGGFITTMLLATPAARFNAKVYLLVHGPHRLFHFSLAVYRACFQSRLSPVYQNADGWRRYLPTE